MLELVDDHCRPVNRKDCSPRSVTNSWDLEWEQCHFSILSFEFVHLHREQLVTDLEHEVVSEELSVESTDNQDLRVRNLAHASALSCSDGRVCVSVEARVLHVDPLPGRVEVPK